MMKFIFAKNERIILLFVRIMGFYFQDITILRYALVAARGASEWNMVYHNVRVVI